MPYRKGTLRRMPPTTRKLARLIGELESATRRVKNLLEDIQLVELDSRALANMNKAKRGDGVERTE